MPEGPELRHSRDRLRNIVVGKKITRLLTSPTGRYKTKSPEGLLEATKDLPLTVTSIDTKGKFMWWTLSGKDKTWYLWCTYGMSGQWSKNAGKHVGFIVEYNDSGSLITRDQQKLFFNDTRRFGTIKLVQDVKQHIKKLNSLGPDILEDPPMSPKLFAERILQKPNRTISEALMDQSCIAGVGNYLKAEILYRTGVSPHRIVTELTADEIAKMWGETLLSSRESYADHGASIRTYKTVDDEKGKTQFYFRIYSQKLCPQKHDVICEETLDKRTSWWCKICQK